MCVDAAAVWILEIRKNLSWLWYGGGLVKLLYLCVQTWTRSDLKLLWKWRIFTTKNSTRNSEILESFLNTYHLFALDVPNQSNARVCMVFEMSGFE